LVTQTDLKCGKLASAADGHCGQGQRGCACRSQRLQRREFFITKNIAELAFFEKNEFYAPWLNAQTLTAISNRLIAKESAASRFQYAINTQLTFVKGFRIASK
jgi:hypothetical protein